MPVVRIKFKAILSWVSVEFAKLLPCHIPLYVLEVGVVFVVVDADQLDRGVVVGGRCGPPFAFKVLSNLAF